MYLLKVKTQGFLNVTCILHRQIGVWTLLATVGIRPSVSMNFLKILEQGPKQPSYRDYNINYCMAVDGDLNIALSILSGIKVRDKGFVLNHTVVGGFDNLRLERAFFSSCNAGPSL